MQLRNVNIGTRLGLGFGLILLAASALLVVVMMSNSSSRAAWKGKLELSGQREDTAEAMRIALLTSAVAVRNMGLQTTVVGVQRDEAEANKQRGAYLSAKAQLEKTELSADERQLFGRLTDIDMQMSGYFKEAVDFAVQFSSEQSGAIITGKIDPLLTKSLNELTAFVQMQKQQEAEAAIRAESSDSRLEVAIATASALVLAIAAVLAWRLTTSITRPLQRAVEATELIAKGDLASSIAVDGHDEAARLFAALRDMRDSLARVVGQVRASSDSIATGSAQIATGNQDLSQRTEEQASNLEQTAASMEQLTATVKSSAESASQANALAASASAAAGKGGEVVGAVVATMQDIAASSKKIADIIGVIDSIAFQTNILALNAAVEAARAGEQGRGFAVVATEVRNLASRSADAAKEIKTLIGASVDKVEAGSRQVDEAGSSMSEIVTQVHKVSQLIGELSNASGEQSLGISQIGDAVGQLDQVTQQNAALVEESAAAAESLREQAAKLTEVVGFFRLGAQAGAAGVEIHKP